MPRWARLGFDASGSTAVHIRPATYGEARRETLMKRLVIAAVLTASSLAAIPASAQVYFGSDYDYRPRREYEYRPRRDYDYESRRDYDGPSRGYYGRRGSSTC